MATTLKIQRFIRSVRQGRTPEPVSCTAMAACTQQAYDALLADSWTRVEEREAGLPRHNWAQTGFSPRWDAAKYCGDYADGYQHGYATAVCYTLRMPADALAGTVAKITSVAIPVHGDRWLADGCDIGVTLSASATPPAWDAPPDDAVTGQLAVVPSNTGVDTSAIVTFDWSAAPKTAPAYLHIALRLTNYLTHRGAWIEGGAMIDGANIAIMFDRDVAPDVAESCPIYAVPRVSMGADGNLSAAPGWDQLWRVVGQQDALGVADPARQAALWSSALVQFPSAALMPERPTTLGGNLPPGAYLCLDEARRATLVAFCRMFAVPPTDGRVMRRLAFDRAISAPVAGTQIIMSLYAMQTAGTAEIGDIDIATVARPEWWRGHAQSVSIAGASVACSPLGAHRIAQAIPSATTFDVAWQSDSPALIAVVLSLARMCASPGFDPGEPYGLVWCPDTIILSME